MRHLPVRRWWYLMPIVFITYSLAYVDRANYGFAVAGGMADDLNITPAVSSLLGSLFFLGYFFCQVPGAIYAEKRSAKVLIFWCLIAWSALATLTGIIPNVNALIVIRFLLGVTEAAVMPAMLVYLSHWFTRAERSRANTFLIMGNPVTILWMSVLSGYLIEHTDWRWMFIIEGVPGLIWAVFWWFLVVDKPEQATWLNDDEKTAIRQSLAEEQRDLKPVKNYMSAFKTPQVLLLCLQYFCWSIGVYGFVLWLPSMLSKAGSLDIVSTGWLSSAPYLAAVIGMLLVSWGSDKYLNRRHFVWPPLCVAGLAFMGSWILGADHFWWSYALLIVAGFGLYAPYGPFFAIIPELLPSNVAGGAMALVNSCGALGGFLGAYGVGYLNGMTGSSSASYIAMGSALLVSAALILCVRPATEKAPRGEAVAAAASR
ncbi:MFS transporter [Larsenimonas rhizosphaerae]|uniref:MFS transporter n=1 Tax=Larsenimonas rhizosphaerae TaxID=2944682 RepID=A0AA41ZK07_9GAMM|nr:MFS transporter [Larsenimonas rhizosphaerae]MCM2131218.1 MFS transporter [Larsenimonas rhizosphaerae]MCX2525423.1 MFS transporter [Larsenimonas rhizosphaerae]